jgi:hypothetical protein
LQGGKNTQIGYSADPDAMVAPRQCVSVWLQGHVTYWTPLNKEGLFIFGLVGLGEYSCVDVDSVINQRSYPVLLAATIGPWQRLHQPGATQGGGIAIRIFSPFHYSFRLVYWAPHLCPRPSGVCNRGWIH